MSGDARMEKSVDGGKAGCVGPDCIAYNYLAPPIEPVNLIPLLLYHPLKRWSFCGTHHRKEALEGDQELYQLLLIP